MKRVLIVAIALLALSALPAAAYQETIGFGASAGLAGFFDGGAWLPIDVFLQALVARPPLFLRMDTGIVIGFQDPTLWFDLSVALGFQVFKNGYVLVAVGGWMPLDIDYDLFEDSIMTVKPGFGYTWRSLYAELYVPFRILDDVPGLQFGWEIKVGYRFSMPGYQSP